MTATAGAMLVEEIVPLIEGAIARGTVKPTGCEDVQELQAEGCAIAAAMLDSAEARGKQVTAGNVAYFALNHLKSGRRACSSGRTDVLSPGASLDGVVAVRSFDEPLGTDEDDPSHEFTLHDCIASSTEDTDVAAARHLDWDLVTPQLDDRRQAILQATSEGRGPGEVACELNITPPRVCQIRESLGQYIVNAWGSNGLEDVTTPSKWRAGLRAVAERRAVRAERARRP